MFGQVALAVEVAGLLVFVSGALRIVRAPVAAARRAAKVSSDGRPDPRYARGLTDFYRISGAIAALAGIILLLIPRFAG